MKRFFVTGTDTGIGKTEFSCALVRALVARGDTPAAWKPCESGGNGDSTALWNATGRRQPFETVCTYRLKAPLAPAMAAKEEGLRVEWRRLLAAFRRFGPGALVVEGAGGVHVPLAGRRDVIDFMEALQLPVIVVARAGLGTLNHVTLTVNAVRGRGLRVGAVVLNGTSPDDPPRTVALNVKALRERLPGVFVARPVPFVRSRAARARAFDVVARAVLDALR